VEVSGIREPPKKAVFSSSKECSWNFYHDVSPKPIFRCLVRMRAKNEVDGGLSQYFESSEIYASLNLDYRITNICNPHEPIKSRNNHVRTLLIVIFGYNSFRRRVETNIHRTL